MLRGNTQRFGPEDSLQAQISMEKLSSNTSGSDWLGAQIFGIRRIGQTVHFVHFDEQLSENESEWSFQ